MNTDNKNGEGEANEPFNLDDILESLHLFDVDFEIESDDEPYLIKDHQLDNLDDLDSFLLIQADDADDSNEAKLPMPDLFVDIFSVPSTDQLLDDQNELTEDNDEDIVADVDTAIEVSPIYHNEKNHNKENYNEENYNENISDEDTDTKNTHLDLEVVANDDSIHIPLQDLEILEDLSEELLMRKGGLMFI